MSSLKYNTTECTECQSFWLLPPPLPIANVSPPGSKWRGHISRFREGGWGSQFRRRDRHYGTLYTNPFSLPFIIEYAPKIRMVIITKNSAVLLQLSKPNIFLMFARSWSRLFQMHLTLSTQDFTNANYTISKDAFREF
jgi:hypothetical protein